MALQSLEPWFAAQKVELYKEKIAQLEESVATISCELTLQQQQLSTTAADIKRIEGEIFQNGGQALENLKAEIQRKTEELTRRKLALSKYQANVKTVKLISTCTMDNFNSNLKQSHILQQQIPLAQELAQSELTNTSVALNKISEEQNEIDTEITSLRLRTSNIPRYLIGLRDELCTAINVPREQLPFVGELLEVKESEAAWEGAIERLLHSFALSLLVPEEYYGTVAVWVNKKSLGTNTNSNLRHSIYPVSMCNACNRLRRN